MPHQDLTLPTGSAYHHQDLKRVLDWLLDPVDFSAARFRDLCTWTPRGLVAAALLWTWSDAAALTERFEAARKIALRALGLNSQTAQTYQAFLKLLRAWTATLALALMAAWRRRMQEDLADRFQVHGYTIFGVDGSRLGLPRTASNECGSLPRRDRRRPGSRPRPRAKAKRSAAAPPPPRRPTARRCG